MAESTNLPITHAVIPAAGLGVRMKPLTSIAPKEMLPLGCKPAAQHIIDELQSVGVTDITFVISHIKDSIRGYFGESACDGTVRLQYVYQEEQRGLADSILQAEKMVDGKPFIVALGDTIIVSEKQVQPLARLINICQSQEAYAGISIEKVATTDCHRYGMVRPSAKSCEWEFEIDMAIETTGCRSLPKQLRHRRTICIRLRNIRSYSPYKTRNWGRTADHGFDHAWYLGRTFSLVRTII